MSQVDAQGPPVSTPEQLREFVRRLEPYSFLVRIAEVSRHEGTETRIGRLFPRVCNSWGLADLARFAIQCGGLYRRREATVDDVIVGMNLINGQIERLTDADTAFTFLYRTAVKQFPDQQSPTQRLGRLLVLFEDLATTARGSYHIPTRFRAVTGQTVEQFMWVTFALWARSMLGHEIDPAMLIAHDIPTLRELIDHDTVHATLRHVSSTLAEFRDRSAIELTDVEGDVRALYSFNPLYTTPLIRLPGSAVRYVAPVPKLLIRRLVDAPYYLLLESDHEAFTKAFGEVFQAYVGWLLRPMVASRLRSEFAYRRRSGEARSPDWLVDEGAAGVALLECKTGRLTKRAKTIATREERRAEFGRIYGGATKQLATFLSEVPNAHECEWLRDRQLEPIVVLLDPIYLAESPVWQDERLAAREAMEITDVIDPFVMSVRALELAESVLAVHPLTEIARGKRADAEQRWWDWETLMGHLGGRNNGALDRRWEAFTRERVPPP